MVVVAIIGILATIAIPAFMDFVKRSKTTEASLQLNKIGKTSKRMVQEIGTFSATSSGAPLPGGGPGPGDACCGGHGGSPGNPSRRRSTTSAPPIRTRFAAILDGSSSHFSVDEPGVYQYSYAGDGLAPSAYAIGDVDCDTVDATYTLQMSKMSVGNPVANLIAPPTGIF